MRRIIFHIFLAVFSIMSLSETLIAAPTKLPVEDLKGHSDLTKFTMITGSTLQESDLTLRLPMGDLETGNLSLLLIVEGKGKGITDKAKKKVAETVEQLGLAETISINNTNSTQVIYVKGGSGKKKSKSEDDSVKEADVSRVLLWITKDNAENDEEKDNVTFKIIYIEVNDRAGETIQISFSPVGNGVVFSKNYS